MGKDERSFISREEYDALLAENAELNKKLAELKEELFNLRFQHTINQLDNPGRMEIVRKDIARVLTVLAEKA